MNLHDALDIAVQVASALAAAHEAGVVHRDIKPENIMLRPDGYAKVLDFGIAKLTEQRPASKHHELGDNGVLQTRPGLVLGTARYMSPEQARGQKVDARSDIWSLGVVLYEMVGGIPPFTGETPSDCIASILKTEPPPLSGVLPDVPLNSKPFCKRLCAKTARSVTRRSRRCSPISAISRVNWKRRLLVTTRGESIVSKSNVTNGARYSPWRRRSGAAAFAYSFLLRPSGAITE